MLVLPSGTKCACANPYARRRPIRQLTRARHSGGPANENDLTLLMSAMVFTPSFFAVVVSSPNESVSENGVLFSTVACRFAASNLFAADQAAAALRGCGWWATSAASTPVYSG